MTMTPGTPRTIRRSLRRLKQSTVGRLYAYPRLVGAVKRVAYLPADMVDRIRRPDELRPPRSAGFFIGRGDYARVGRIYRQYFIDHGGLRPDEHVLDVGSGIGRMAVPLTTYLDDRGSYRGFDVSRAGVTWCQENITPRFPNFQFRHVDVFNRLYNPRGTITPADLQFPFGEGCFDFVILTSVFTHMLEADLENYVGEIRRVLKPQGRAFMTFFLLNERATRASREGTSIIDFPARVGEHAAAVNPHRPEDVIAYSEEYVRNLCEGSGLKIREPVVYGNWTGVPSELDTDQDIVVAVKPAADRAGWGGASGQGART